MTPPKEPSDSQTNKTNDYEDQKNRNNFEPAPGSLNAARNRDAGSTGLVQVDHNALSIGLVSVHSK
jgi:hypothetical protein